LNVNSFQGCSHRQTFRWSNVSCFILELYVIVRESGKTLTFT
jgi:hypothetical protein